MSGYIIEIAGERYDGFHDGRPFTLADAWRQSEGIRNTRILSPTGRVVLDNAGSTYRRTWEMPQLVRALRMHARMLRRSRPDEIRPCPWCGARCYRTSNLWNHPRSETCDLEFWHVNSEPTPRPPL